MAPRRKKDTHRIYFADEVPSIGAGYRGITLLKLGRKWVHILEGASGTKARIKLSLWNSLPKRGPNGETEDEIKEKSRRREQRREAKESRRLDKERREQESVVRPSDAKTSECAQGASADDGSGTIQ